MVRRDVFPVFSVAASAASNTATCQRRLPVYYFTTLTETNKQACIFSKLNHEHMDWKALLVEFVRICHVPRATIRRHLRPLQLSKTWTVPSATCHVARIDRRVCETHIRPYVLLLGAI
jgi:hypothetical protein